MHVGLCVRTCVGIGIGVCMHVCRCMSVFMCTICVHVCVIKHAHVHVPEKLLAEASAPCCSYTEENVFLSPVGVNC